MAASSSNSSPVLPQADHTPDADATTAGDKGVEYPQLPHIGSRLGCMVYSHKGVYGTVYTKGQDYLEEPKDNERLTFIGATALQLCVGLHLYDKYPLKLVGFLTKLRGVLVSNEMLAHWATAYEMPKQLRAHASAMEILQANPKVAAAIFEAFVGALLEESGLEATRAWIGRLVDAQLAITPEEDIPGLADAIEGKRTPSPTQSGARSAPASPTRSETKNRLAILNERASQLNKVLVWTEEPQGPEHSRSWQLTVSVDGTIVGKAVGDKKHSAKVTAADAAWEALGWK